MVSPDGHFKLVDYDCMCVPELQGQPNVELGMDPYQHPGRKADTPMFPGLDNFSALVTLDLPAGWQVGGGMAYSRFSTRMRTGGAFTDGKPAMRSNAWAVAIC